MIFIVRPSDVQKWSQKLFDPFWHGDKKFDQKKNAYAHTSVEPNELNLSWNDDKKSQLISQSSFKSWEVGLISIIDTYDELVCNIYWILIRKKGIFKYSLKVIVSIKFIKTARNDRKTKLHTVNEFKNVKRTKLHISFKT